MYVAFELNKHPLLLLNHHGHPCSADPNTVDRYEGRSLTRSHQKYAHVLDSILLAAIVAILPIYVKLTGRFATGSLESLKLAPEYWFAEVKMQR